MATPLFDEAGNALPVTRIELEPLGDGRVRWSAWNGDRLHLMTTANIFRREEMAKVLESTMLILSASATRQTGP